jgi:hypothetical protein
MKKIILFMFVLLSLFWITACEEPDDSKREISDDLPSEEIIDNKTPTKEDAISFVGDIKTRLIKLGATDSSSLSKIQFLDNETTTLIPKDDIRDIVGTFDLEWIDMSMIVTNFTEHILLSNYELETVRLVNEVVSDQSIFGWPLEEDATVYIEYINDKLYMQIYRGYDYQSFLFHFDEFDNIKIFRMDESEDSIYIEDFTEKTGLSYCSIYEDIHCDLYLTYKDNDMYYIYNQNDSKETTFTTAYYQKDDIVIFINHQQDKLRIMYDMHDITGFDYVDLEGNFYLEGTMLDSEFSEVTVYEGTFNYTVYGIKYFVEDTDTLSLNSFSYENDISYQTIKEAITTGQENLTTTHLHFNYNVSKEELITQLDELLNYNH